jgi:hypothetical protein
MSQISYVWFTYLCTFTDLRSILIISSHISIRHLYNNFPPQGYKTKILYELIFSNLKLCMIH